MDLSDIQYNNDKCELLQDESTERKFMGAGIAGIVYVIKEKQNNMIYAVKYTSLIIYMIRLIYNNWDRNVEYIRREMIYRNNFWFKKDLFNLDVLMAINNITENNTPKIGDIILVPVYTELCDVHTNSVDIIVQDYGNGNILSIPNGSYICSNTSYVEFLLLSVLSKIYNTGICINFMKIYFLVVCDKKINIPIEVKEKLWVNRKNKDKYIILDSDDDNLYKNKIYDIGCYIFMEFVDSNLYSEFIKIDMSKFNSDMLDKNLFDKIILQVILALLLLSDLKIYHNDLHLINIGLLYVNESTVWKGKKLINYKYYNYKYKDIDITFESCQYIVKILDFGFGSKTSIPIILSNFIYQQNSAIHTPITYYPNRDFVYFILHLYYSITLIKPYFEEFINEIFDGYPLEYIYSNKNRIINNNILPHLIKCSPDYILTKSVYFSRYRYKNDNSINLGIVY